MKNYIYTFIVSLIIVAIYEFVKKKHWEKKNNLKKNTMGNRECKPVDVNKQIEVFSELGITINNKIDREKLIKNGGGKECFEKSPYENLYFLLGGFDDDTGTIPITNKLYYFDTEAIYETGDYKNILENLVRISNDSFPCKNSKDFIDTEKNRAHISFDIFGDHYQWDLRVDDDRVDSDFFTKISEI